MSELARLIPVYKSLNEYSEQLGIEEYEGGEEEKELFYIANIPINGNQENLVFFHLCLFIICSLSQDQS
jgi:hypothetical protein